VKIQPGVLTGSIVFEPLPRLDDDGGLVRIFDAELAAAAGLDCRSLVQDHRVRLERGAVFGLRLRTDGGEGLLASSCSGAVVMAAVDLRPGSDTYRCWMTAVLDDDEHRSVWLPPGLAHGYQALSERATVCYRANRVRQPWRETVIRPDDPELGIPWPLPVEADLGARPLDVSGLAMVEPFLTDWFGALS
jgi:dTDP-4-dehydrorhamnose 3,5-epimerase